ncbi:MAG: phospholipase D family protein [Sandaracinaceae bacterium]|nr:phospholipase D family protein [Sandaracinaceae bacterium]
MRRHRACHAKLYIVDDVAVLGSANLSERAFSGDVWELGVRTDDSDLVQALVEQFRRIECESVPISKSDMEKLRQVPPQQMEFERPRFEWPQPSDIAGGAASALCGRRLGDEFLRLRGTEVDPGALDEWNAWLLAHPGGYLMNHKAGGARDHKLHRVSCHIWTKTEKSSLVAVPRPRHDDLRILKSAAQQVGLETKPCKLCFRGRDD